MPEHLAGSSALRLLPPTDKKGTCTGCGLVPTRELGNCPCAKEIRGQANRLEQMHEGRSA